MSHCCRPGRCGGALRSFCAFVSDPAYDWPAECERRFGSHPVQIVHEWNSAVHVQDNESRPEKRAFTIDELQEFFDYWKFLQRCRNPRSGPGRPVMAAAFFAAPASHLGNGGWQAAVPGGCRTHA